MVDANTTTKAAKTVLTPLMEDVSKFGNSAKDLGKNAAAAFGRAGETGVGSFLGRITVAPVRIFVKVARWPVAMASGIFKHAGPIGVAATVVGAALGGTALLRNRAERRTQENAMGDLMTAQGFAESAPSYKNSVTPDEAAMVEALQKQAGKTTGHADAVSASRQATPETATAL